MSPDLSRAAFGTPRPARHVMIFVNGILTRPGDHLGWTDRAVHWFNNQETGVSSYAFEYATPALTRRLFQARHADNLAETIAQYPKDHLHLVGHSNGCDLIARALRLTSRHITSVHLISAALERDFRKNGLGERIAREQIGRTYCYCSRGDHVLRYLAPASRWASLHLLGYGDLGATGAAKPVPPRVAHTWRDTMGHGDWFAPEHFDTTMQMIRDHAFDPQP